MNTHNPSAANLAAEEGLRRLIEGNQRFVQGKVQHPHQDLARRQEVIAGQSPFAVILTCSDSRVPPEILFDQGIGDLFVVRTAGNVIDDIALGSIEYAVEHLKVPLVLVLGHQKCGAVSATAKGEEVSGHIQDVAKEILPAVKTAKKMQGDLIANSIDVNIVNVVNKLKTSKPLLVEFEESGKLEVAGGRYDLDSGLVVMLNTGE